jgi:hypothetical protein
MVRQTGDKRLMVFWYTELVGRMVRGKEGIEKTVESASAYEPDVANFHGTIRCRRTGIPQGMSTRRVLDRKLCAEDVVVSHRWWQE